MADARQTFSADRSLARRRVLPLACLVVLWIVAAPAWASHLVQVRVGNHPTFTRVVFEFDATTGYRVERHAAGERDDTIVVTLDAGATARDIASRSPGVERVTVEAGTENTVARIFPRKSGLPVKEMILSSPPRVVLDLMLPVAAKARADETPPRPAVATPEPEPTPEAAPTPPPPLAEAEPSPPPRPERVEPEPAEAEPLSAAVEPEPAPVATLPAPVPPSAESEFEPEVIAEPADALIPEPDVVAEPAPEIETPEEPGPEVAEAEAEEVLAEPVLPEVPTPEELAALEGTLPETEDEASAAADAVATEIAEAAVANEGEPSAPTPEARPPSRRVTVPAVQTPEPAESAWPLDEVTLGAIAGGVLALLLVVFLVARSRRALPANIDVTSFAVDADDAAASDTERIPAGGFSMDSPVGGAPHEAEDFELGKSAEPGDENKPIESVAASGGGSGLFDEPAEEKEAMTMEHQDLPITRTDSEAATQMGIGAGLAGASGDSDLARLVQELERRVAHMETRLDESIDARERLERQVAAQSEELRVQRAAIARTQRALRSLNRTEEDQATEPALRDPAKPVGPQ